MSDVLIVSCRLCLQADEIISMVTIDRPLGAGPGTVQLSICRPCARAIAAELQQLDTDGAEEVRSNVETPSQSTPTGHRDPGGAPTGDSLVSGPVGDEAAAGLDRREPEVSAGSADRSGENS